MGVRIHTAGAQEISVAIAGTAELVKAFDDEFADVGSALVIEDAGNREAWVITGDRHQWSGIANAILAAVSAPLPTRDERLVALRGEFPHDIADCISAGPERYLLIEACAHGSGERYFTCHDSLADAADYHDMQEEPENWRIEVLIDLDTGERSSADTRLSTSFTPSPLTETTPPA